MWTDGKTWHEPTLTKTASFRALLAHTPTTLRGGAIGLIVLGPRNAAAVLH